MTTPTIPRDMPKLESPFVRRNNEKGDYVVFPEVAPGYEWVFNEDAALATEKLDGTDVSIIIQNGTIVSVWNRMNPVPFFNKERKHISEAILNSYDRGYCALPDGQWFGEAIGPKINGNPYKLDEHLWIPFDTYVRKHLAYSSWGKYPKTFEAISEWFRGGLMSLFMLQRGVKDATAEGVVFHRPSTGEMAKLRLDMFPWFQGRRHKQ